MALIDRTKGIPREILALIPRSDRQNIIKGNDELVSPSTIQLIDQGRRERGTMSEMLDVATAIGGGIAGGAAGGAAFGPVGAVVGGVLGGAAGAFGGSIAEDALDDRNIDLERASIEAGKSVAFDAATLGAFRAIRPIARVFGSSANKVANAALPGTGKNILQDIKVEDFGPGMTSTPESRIISERILGEGVEVDGRRVTSGLDIVQTRRAGRAQEFANDLSQIGLLSKEQAEARGEDAATVLLQSLKNLFRRTEVPEKSELGEELFVIINGAKNALITNQRVAKNAALKNLPRGTGVRASLVRNYLDSFLRPGSQINVFNKGSQALSDEAKSKIRAILNELPTQESNPNISMDALLKLEDSFRTKIADVFATQGLEAQSKRNAQAQLAAIQSEFSDHISKVLEPVAPGIRSEFAEINKTFREGLDKIIPDEVGEEIVRADNKNNYQKLGEALGTLVGPDVARDVTKTKKLMESVRAAYKVKGFKPKNLKTAEEAIQYIRDGYGASKLAPVLNAETVQDLTPLLSGFQKKDYVEHAKAILGNETYNSMKNIINAIQDATYKKERGFLSLGLKSREISNIAQVAGPVSQVGVAGLAIGAGNIPAALAIFASPYVLGKIVNRRKAVNKLLLLDKSFRQNPEKYLGNSPEKIKFAVSSAMKVIEELSEKDKVDIQEYLRYM